MRWFSTWRVWRQDCTVVFVRLVVYLAAMPKLLIRHDYTEKWHLRAQTVRTESISQKDWDNIIELEFILGTRLTTRERFLENANGALGFSRSG